MPIAGLGAEHSALVAKQRLMIQNALSIDLEDWFHAELVRSRMEEVSPMHCVEEAVEPILTLLQQYGVRATFFVVGEVMRHHPHVVRRIYEQGHEIGCHGWSHRPLWTLNPKDLAEELEEFDRDAAGVLPVDEVIGFRAPTFSLDERTAWALDILRDHGFRYDSSIFPMRNYLYGVNGCPPRPYHPTGVELTRDHEQQRRERQSHERRENWEGADFIEFPMTAIRLAGLQVPVSGGFYLRAMPLPILRYLLRRVNAEGRPFVIYLHPWEADERTPRVRGLSPLERLVTYYNSGSVLRKLEALLQSFSFAPLRQVLGIQGGRQAATALR
jgi:polysaccharide deacetylase family protein (PEP-CTERM system associated)